uniref:Secreted protein n=1 Tax=Anguilla anguilla TaxID=7936 RepID=A0A0E9SVD0_ANGAN
MPAGILVLINVFGGVCESATSDLQRSSAVGKASEPVSAVSLPAPPAREIHPEQSHNGVDDLGERRRECERQRGRIIWMDSVQTDK